MISFAFIYWAPKRTYQEPAGRRGRLPTRSAPILEEDTNSPRAPGDRSAERVKRPGGCTLGAGRGTTMQPKGGHTAELGSSEGGWQTKLGDQARRPVYRDPSAQLSAGDRQSQLVWGAALGCRTMDTLRSLSRQASLPATVSGGSDQHLQQCTARRRPARPLRWGPSRRPASTSRSGTGSFHLRQRARAGDSIVLPRRPGPLPSAHRASLFLSCRGCHGAGGNAGWGAGTGFCSSIRAQSWASL